MCHAPAIYRSWWALRVLPGAIVAAACLALYVLQGRIDSRLEGFSAAPFDGAAFANGAYTYAADLSCAQNASDSVCANFTTFAAGALASAGNPPVLPFGCSYRHDHTSLLIVIGILGSLFLGAALLFLSWPKMPALQATLVSIFVLAVIACTLLLEVAVPLRRSTEFDVCWPKTGYYDFLDQPVVGDRLEARNGWAQGLVPDAATYRWLRDVVRPRAPQLQLQAAAPQNFSVPYQAHAELALRIVEQRRAVQIQLATATILVASLAAVALLAALVSDVGGGESPPADAPCCGPGSNLAPPPRSAGPAARPAAWALQKLAPAAPAEHAGKSAPAAAVPESPAPGHGARNRPPPSP